MPDFVELLSVLEQKVDGIGAKSVEVLVNFVFGAGINDEFEHSLINRPAFRIRGQWHIGEKKVLDLLAKRTS